ASTAPPTSLTQRAARGAAWVLGGYTASQVIRLGGNLVLTRLLFPEAFGVMAIVNTLLQGLQMFSDVGIGPAIIRSQRVDAGLLNTAWTLQIIRGLSLCLIGMLLAWPAAVFYGRPELTGLMIAAAITAAIDGFNSPALFTLNRDLKLKQVVARDLASQVLGVIVMIALALVWRSVWPLVIGALVRGVANMLLSHGLTTQRLRPGWDRGALRELYSFGRFVFLSTAATFIAQGGERLILGKFLPMETLGVFAIALYLSQLPWQVVQKLTNRVLFPSFAELLRKQRARAIHLHRRARLAFQLLSIGLMLVWLVGGQWLVDWLYDPRYVAAGWMVQFLGLRAVCDTVRFPQQKMLTAAGFPIYTMLASVSLAIGVSAGLILALTFGGLTAALTVLALSPMPGLYIQTWGMCRHFPEVRRGELLDALISSVAVLAVAIYLNGWGAAS
ncbi:MAG: oligosaccharide flippase family protein, partial [Parvularculaceae bacterium]|nr:oligosaccharide flippase family protein [Parvularculaceae bacterium]